MNTDFSDTGNDCPVNLDVIQNLHDEGENLLGALVGGMLESMSLWTGIRSLIIIAAALYFLSFLFLRSAKTGGAPRLSMEPSGHPA